MECLSNGLIQDDWLFTTYKVNGKEYHILAYAMQIANGSTIEIITHKGN